MIVSRPVPEPESFDAWMATVTKVDGDGQIWRMVDIDPEVFDSQAIAQIEENIANATDEDEVDEWTPFSWTMGTCPGNIPAAIWSGETRSSNTSFSTNRAANAVYTYLPVASVRALSSRGPSPGGATLSPQHIALPHPVDRQRP
ncbi:MAG: hypothetical protein H6734_13995 [Alphaproteobacteria bacterium]|nr:hypothetical protein [Alphaproteobacteria bacterium]